MKISISYQNESYEEQKNKLNNLSTKLIRFIHYQLNKIVNK